MQSESIIDGWLADVSGQGMHTYGDAPAIATTANFDLQHLNPSRKRRAFSLPIVEKGQKRQRLAMGDDESPRAVRSASRHRNQASKYTASINNASASSLANLTSSTTLSQSSVASVSKPPSRTRSRSPAKTVRDLENADPPTRYLQMRHPGNELPSAVKTLNNKSRLTPYLDEWDTDDANLFADDTTDEQVHKTFGEILRIYTNARTCSECDKPEASWGEEVVRPLLDLVASRTNGRVVVENVTSTNIQPPTLIPRGSGIEGLPYEGKRVDYGLFILPTEDETRRIKDRLKRIPGKEVGSINQTALYYTREKPLLSSVELKITRSNHDPLLQLAIWNSALFQRLEGLFDLTDKADEMLPIPSVTVSGHTWNICYSYVEKGGCRMLRGVVEIGSTDNVLGVYRIMAGLGVITAYGVEEYWPWLSEQLLL